MTLIGPAYSPQFMEWHNSVSQHLSMLYVSQMFFKIAVKPNNYQFYLPNFFKFCDNISHKLLSPSQILGKFLPILVWSTLQK